MMGPIRIFIFASLFPLVVVAADFGYEYAPTLVNCPMSENSSLGIARMEMKRRFHGGQAEYDLIYQANHTSEIVKMNVKTIDFRIRIGRLTGKVYDIVLSGEGDWKGEKRSVYFLSKNDSPYSVISIQNHVYNSPVVCHFEVPPLKPDDSQLKQPGLLSYAINARTDKTLDLWPLLKSQEILRKLVKKTNTCWAPQFEILSAQGKTRYLEPIVENQFGSIIPRCWISNGERLLEDDDLFMATGGSSIYFWRVSDGKLVNQIEVGEVGGVKHISLRQPLGFDPKRNADWITATSYGGGHYFLISLDRKTKKVSSFLDLSSARIKSVIAIKRTGDAQKILARATNGAFVMLDEKGEKEFEAPDTRVAVAFDGLDIFYLIRGADDYNAGGEVTAYDLQRNILWSRPLQMYVTPGAVSLIDDRLLIGGQVAPSNVKLMSYDARRGQEIADFSYVDACRIYQDYTDAWVTTGGGACLFFIRPLSPEKLFTSAWYLNDTGSSDTNSVEKVWSLKR